MLRTLRDKYRSFSPINRRNRKAAGRIDLMRHLLKWDDSGPLVVCLPARAIAAFRESSNGNAAHTLVADMAFDVGENQVEGRDLPGSSCLAKLLGRLREIRAQEHRQPVTGLGPKPGATKPVLSRAPLQAGCHQRSAHCAKRLPGGRFGYRHVLQHVRCAPALVPTPLRKEKCQDVRRRSVLGRDRATEQMLLVSPQATRALRPIMMAGTPT